MLLALCCIAFGAARAVEQIIRAPSFPASQGTRPLTLEALQELRNLNLNLAEPNRIHWVDVQGEPDGYRVFRSQNDSLVLENVVSRKSSVVLSPAQIPRNATGVSFNVNRSKAFWTVNVTKNYRYSSYANYLVQDLTSGETKPLDPSQQGDVQYAVWSPRDPDVIAFVRNNNIFLWENGAVRPVTTDGGPELFHGVPDWVYEEEITEGRHTLWFSPDGEYIAYLSFDNKDVPIFTVPYYMNRQKLPPTYPRELKLKYPKTGSPNPIVKANLVNTKGPFMPKGIPLEASWPSDNIVVGEVAWLTDAHDRLIIRCLNRIQNLDKHIQVEVESGAVRVVRERNGTDGWLDNTKAIKWVGKLSAGENEISDEYYLDLSDEDGWRHVYLHSATGATPSRQLTKGEWEVRSISSIDRNRSTIIYTSTEVHPTESHPYTLSLLTGEKKALGGAKTRGFWQVHASPRGEYYVLQYAGPNVPFQQLYSRDEPDKPIRTITANKAVVRLLEEYARPEVQFFDLPHPSGFNLSAKMVLPSNFDRNKKYPVLFTPYGGPGSQEVRKSFGLFSRSIFAATDPATEYITYTVDNRGTGWRGRQFRNFFSRAMGVIEPEDQIWAARQLALEPYVDDKRIGIWGWSHGGYLSAKVIEQNSGVFSFAVSTAPTTDLRLYDSMFMERFMGLPAVEKEAYDRAAVRNPEGFKNIAGSVLVQHGTGDDNVHFQHAAAMTDLMMGAGVSPEKFQASFFPDSDHGINYNNAGKYQMAQLKNMLVKEKNRVIEGLDRSKTPGQKVLFNIEKDEEEFEIGKTNDLLERLYSSKFD